MKPISEEKRGDIVRLKQAKKKETEIAEFLGVCIGTVRKIWGIFMRTGDYVTMGYKGRISTVTPETDKKILEIINEKPSITLLEIIEDLSLNISESGLSKRLKRQGMTYKKRLSMQKHSSEKMSSSSEMSGVRIKKELDSKKVFFFDESSINTAMQRLYGRAFKGERVNAAAKDTRFERISVMSVLGLEGVRAPMTFNGTLNAEIFRPYVEQVLAPEMNKGDIFVLDNCSVHKVKNVLKPLIDKGVTVLFLPPYSPDLNPIEMSWSKVKAYLKKIAAETIDELNSSLADAFDLFCPTDIQNWFRHDGYTV